MKRQTVDSVFKIVSYHDYAAFLAHYPRKLTVHVWTSADPPGIEHYDAELEISVANTCYYSDDPTAHYYCPESERVYTIISNLEEVLQDRRDNHV